MYKTHFNKSLLLPDVNIYGIHTVKQLLVSASLIMRPSSLGGGRILRRTLSVCPSVPWLFTLEHRSHVSVNLADVRYLLFCLHVRAAYRRAISAAQACFIGHYTNNSNSGSGQDK